MTTSRTAVAVLASMLYASSVLADAHCKGPILDGNTWNLVCSDDGKGDAEYQCNYQISVKNADGISDTVDASGSVAQGQEGIVIWSTIELQGSPVVSASIDSGSCTPD